MKLIIALNSKLLHPDDLLYDWVDCYLDGLFGLTNANKLYRDHEATASFLATLKYHFGEGILHLLQGHGSSTEDGHSDLSIKSGMHFNLTTVSPRTVIRHLPAIDIRHHSGSNAVLNLFRIHDAMRKQINADNIVAVGGVQFIVCHFSTDETGIKVSLQVDENSGYLFGSKVPMPPDVLDGDVLELLKSHPPATAMREVHISTADGLATMPFMAFPSCSIEENDEIQRCLDIAQTEAESCCFDCRESLLHTRDHVCLRSCGDCTSLKIVCPACSDKGVKSVDDFERPCFSCLVKKIPCRRIIVPITAMDNSSRQQTLQGQRAKREQDNQILGSSRSLQSFSMCTADPDHMCKSYIASLSNWLQFSNDGIVASIRQLRSLVYYDEEFRLKALKLFPKLISTLTSNNSQAFDAINKLLHSGVVEIFPEQPTVTQHYPAPYADERFKEGIAKLECIDVMCATEVRLYVLSKGQLLKKIIQLIRNWSRSP